MKELSKIEIINDYFLNYADIIYLKTDHNGYIIECNDFAKKMFNRELVKENIREMIIFENRNISLNKFTENENPVHLTCKIDKETTETFLFKFYKINENFMIFSGYDSKEIKTGKKQTLKIKNDLAKLNKYIKKTNQQLQELNEVKNKNFTLAAHNIKNHLSAIIMNIEFLVHELENRIDHLEKNYFSDIKSTVSLLYGIILKYLSSCDIAGETLITDHKLYDINTFIAETMSICETMAKSSNIKLQVIIGSGLKKIYADAEKLMHALRNIVINAVEYSIPDSEIYIDIIKKNDEMLFTVKDHGRGIPDGIKEKLMENISYAGSDNAALGLAISKKIIEAHKGRIWFESEKGGGSTFYFAIPLKEDDIQKNGIL